MQNIKFPDEVKNLPETPGVYQFLDKNGHIIYIGKAKNLKSRVRSYTSLKLLEKTAKMVSNASTLNYIEVESELEALLLEAKLVRTHLPLFNIELRDDKTPLYIGITKEEFPRVLTLRQTQLKEIPLKRYFGPYVDGSSAKYVLKKLRRVFTFSTHRPGRKACIYSEIGLCSPCPSVIANTEDPSLQKLLKAEYMSNIRRLSSVLDGRAKKIEKELVAQMEALSKEERFEKAQAAKEILERFTTVLNKPPKLEEYINNPNFIEDLRGLETRQLTSIVSKHFEITALHRIECFDIAHLSGTNPTASMITFIDGEAEKRYYRHFKINKGKAQNSDVDSMTEVIKRRIKHFDDWGKPDLIIIDGGKPQLSAVHQALDGLVPFVGLAKRYETLVFLKDGEFSEFLLPDSGAKNLVVRMRNEAHRFARRLHHNLVTKTLLGE